MKFGEALDIIDKFYADGGRCLYLEGGEPLLWNDHAHTLNDVIDYINKLWGTSKTNPWPEQIIL